MDLTPEQAAHMLAILEMQGALNPDLLAELRAELDQGTPTVQIEQRITMAFFDQMQTEQGGPLHTPIDDKRPPLDLRVGDAERAESEVASPSGPPPRIDVDNGLFATEQGMSKECVRLVSHEPEKAAAALRRAGNRFSNVTTSGWEVGATEEPPNWDPDDPDEDTPNWVSEVRTHESGPWLYVDCKGYVGDARRATFVAILKQEIHRSGLQEARLESPAGFGRDE